MANTSSLSYREQSYSEGTVNPIIIESLLCSDFKGISTKWPLNIAIRLYVKINDY